MHTYRSILGCALLAMAALLVACSSKPPGCADSETLATAKNMIADNSGARIARLKDAYSDDPDGWLPKFFSAMKVEITNVVSEGYNADAKKQSCRGNLKITAPSGATSERAIEYSTQKTEDQKGAFLLEIQDLAPFVEATALQARKYYNANRYSGTWSGAMTCKTYGNSFDGSEEPFSAMMSMVVAQGGENPTVTIEHPTPGGGAAAAKGEFIENINGSMAPVELKGPVENSKLGETSERFVVTFKGHKAYAEGNISYAVVTTDENGQKKQDAGHSICQVSLAFGK